MFMKTEIVGDDIYQIVGEDRYTVDMFVFRGEEQIREIKNISISSANDIIEGERKKRCCEH